MPKDTFKSRYIPIPLPENYYRDDREWITKQIAIIPGFQRSNHSSIYSKVFDRKYVQGKTDSKIPEHGLTNFARYAANSYLRSSVEKLVLAKQSAINTGELIDSKIVTAYCEFYPVFATEFPELLEKYGRSVFYKFPQLILSKENPSQQHLLLSTKIKPILIFEIEKPSSDLISAALNRFNFKYAGPISIRENLHRVRATDATNIQDFESAKEKLVSKKVDKDFVRKVLENNDVVLKSILEQLPF